MTEQEKINGWTFEETIKTAENLMINEQNMFKWDVLRHLRDFAETFKEELQQYREIGTLEELQKAKEQYDDINSVAEQTALMGLSDFARAKEAVKTEIKRSLDYSLKEYQKIGTVEELKALKEKSEPKIPNYEGDGYYAGQIVLDTWICPECGKAYEVDYEDYEYCPNCGQHIDHSSLTEDT